MKLLVVEDDKTVGQYVKRGLEEQQYLADWVPDGAEALRLMTATAYDLVILDGPAMPAGEPGRKLIEIADGLVAILPVSLDINECMEDVIASLGGAERKLVGVVLDELNPVNTNRQRDKQYA